MFGRKKKEREEHPPPVFTDDWGPCQIEGCQGEVLRQTGYCKYHWREQLEKMELEREEERKVAEKRMQSKDWTKQQQRNWFASKNRQCSRCGTHGLHTCVEKPKAEQPKNPKNYEETLMVLCKDCLADH
jgi:hypothetical protein